MIEPDAYRVGYHVGGDHLRGDNGQHIGALAADQDGVAVPVRRVRVVEVAESGHVPAHVIVFVHHHHGHVAVNVSVDGPLDISVGKARAGDGAEDPGCGDGLEFVPVELGGIGNVGLDVVVEIPALVFVEGDEDGDELLVHVLGMTVGPGHAAAGDDDAAEQSRGHVAQLVAVGVVEPEERAWIVGAGSGAIGDGPDVGVRGAGSDAAVGFVFPAGAVVVVGALGVFGIVDTVGMHAVRTRGVVFEDDLDGVADLGVEDGADEAEVGVLRRARLEMRKGRVGVFVVDGFLVDAADVVGAGFGVAFGDGIEWHAHGFIAAGRRVVPVHFIGRDVVDTRLA